MIRNINNLESSICSSISQEFVKALVCFNLPEGMFAHQRDRKRGRVSMYLFNGAWSYHDPSLLSISLSRWNGQIEETHSHTHPECFSNQTLDYAFGHVRSSFLNHNHYTDPELLLIHLDIFG